MPALNPEDTAWALRDSCNITNPFTSYYYGDPIHPISPRVVGIGDENVLRAYERELNRQAHPTLVAAPACQHCFCGELLVNMKAHESCCMCATRRVKP